MKSTTVFFSLILALAITDGISAQEIEAAEIPQIENANGLFITFSEGAAASWLTRIIFQTDRSNFVFSDFLPGAYFKTELHNIKYITPMARIAAYYPLVSTFNQFPQKPTTPLHFGIDFNAGVRFALLDFSYFRLNLGPALHLFFLNSDRWNYFELGAAALLGMEVPLTERWTFLVGGIASLDNGNLGANRQMEPFDIAYQYQVDIGVRYSKKLTNKTYLFPKKYQPSEPPVILR